MDAVVRATHKIQETFDVTTDFDRVEPGDAAAQQAGEHRLVSPCSASTRSGWRAPRRRPQRRRRPARAQEAEEGGARRPAGARLFVREGVPVSAPGQLVDAREALLAYVAAAQEPATPVPPSREHRALETLRDILTRVRILLG